MVQQCRHDKRYTNLQPNLDPCHCCQYFYLRIDAVLVKRPVGLICTNCIEGFEQKTAYEEGTGDIYGSSYDYLTNEFLEE